MKKTFLLASLALALCLILGACFPKSPAPSEVSSSESSTETSSLATESELSSSDLPSSEVEPSSSDTANSSSESYVYYPVLDKIEALTVGDGYDEGLFYELSDEKREELYSLLHTEDWVIAEDLPPMGLSATFYIHEDNGKQVWFFNQYDEDRLLIVPSFPNKDNREYGYS